MNKKLIPVIGIILILVVGGYVFMQKKSGSPVSPEIQKAQQEMMVNCKFDADFCKYASNGIVAMSGGYTMTSESTFEDKKSKMIMKADGKENSSTVSYTDGKEEGSFISLNKTTYMKDAGSKEWIEFPPTKDETGKQTTNLFDFESLKKELGNVKKNTKEVEDTLMVKKVGSEKCGSATCSIFEMKDKNTPDYTTKIWVDTTDYYARKMESTSKQGLSVMTFEYGPVTITKPSPVKQMPSFESGAIKSGGSVDMEQIEKMMNEFPAEETPAE